MGKFSLMQPGMVSIIIQNDNTQLHANLQHAASAPLDTTELMNQLKIALVSETLLHFHHEGRPAWAECLLKTMARLPDAGLGG